MRVAVVGTGIMGAGMARSLRREGMDVVAWNRTRSRADPLAEDGIDVADSVETAVTGVDAVLTALYDTDAVLAVAPDVAAALGTDAVWLQTSTLGRAGMRRVADSVAGTALLDVPVLGTKKPAEDGTLVVLLSGPEHLARRVAPVLDAIGSRTVHAGPEVGAASALKLACNAWIGMLTAGTAQSVALAAALGVDPQLFLDAIAGTATDSPYAQLKGAAMLAGEHPTSFSIDGVIKDTDLMIEAAEAVDFPTDLLETVRALFAQASEQGHGEQDMGAVRAAFP